MENPLRRGTVLRRRGGTVARRLVSAGLLAALGASLGCGSGGGSAPAPAAPDFTAPGSFGTLPAGLTQERGTEVSVESAIPSPLPCGTDHDFTVRVRQQIAVCETFDYRPLYDRAIALAQARAAQLTCPPECPEKQGWLVSQAWDCFLLGDPPFPVATVLVRWGVRCVAAGTPPPIALDPPPPGPLHGPLLPEVPPLGSFETITEEVGGFVDPPCGTRDLVTCEYFEEVASCEIASYLPFVQRADARARFLHDQLRCDDGCAKDPYVVQRLEWACAPGAENFVHVRLWFALRCNPP